MKLDTMDDMDCFIPLDITGQVLPKKFNFPFYYNPHPIAVLAAEHLQSYIKETVEKDYSFGFSDEDTVGKMFGILVVKKTNNDIGYLAAFSGKLGDTNHYPGFVPPVFDTLNPNGFFKKGEAEISAINRTISKEENHPDLLSAYQLLKDKETEAETTIKELTAFNKQEKLKRKKLRAEAQMSLSEKELESFNKSLDIESTRQYYHLKETKKEWSQKLNDIRGQIEKMTAEIKRLKALRKSMSANLQNGLFESYSFLNQYNESKNLIDIFQITEHCIPPSGAGECAAPKLLQYAFNHGLIPVTMAEFWWGKPPASEIRKHGQYYPACNGKCKPILGHMLKDIPMDDNPMLINPAEGRELPIVFEDDHIIVVNKPEDFLSVPGKSITDSVFTRIRTLYPHASGPLIVHRLDMSTSGIMILAKSKLVHQHLQAQFIKHRAKKRYVAILKGEKSWPEKSGEIDLPLRVDLDDRPRQLVDYDHGKPALTHWELIETQGDEHRIFFYPKTGRTHQLRVHASHPLGLNIPIKGDDLYGTKEDRLYLHAQRLELFHPVTKEWMVFEAEVPF